MQRTPTGWRRGPLDGENLYTWGDGLASVAEVQDDSDLECLRQRCSPLPTGEGRRAGNPLIWSVWSPLKEEDTDDTSQIAVDAAAMGKCSRWSMAETCSSLIRTLVKQNCSGAPSSPKLWG